MNIRGQGHIRELWWELFRRKNLDGEKLPQTIGTLISHIQRANSWAWQISLTNLPIMC